MAQGVAWAAREAGVPRARSSRRTRRRARSSTRSSALGGEVIPVPHEEWWQAMVDRGHEGVDGLFVHPVEDEAVMAGNGTIGLELVEDLAAFDTVVIPWGGGGLTTGIASAVKALRPGVRVVTAEPETARRSPRRSRPASRPRSTSGRRSSTAPAAARCCRRCGSARASSSTRRSRSRSTRSPRRCALLASRAHVVAEGAGALALAAALRGDAGEGRVVCIVSGGNIDAVVLAAVLCRRERLLRAERELGDEAVDLVRGVVVDEADAQRVLSGYGSFSRRPSEYQLSCAHTP